MVNISNPGHRTSPGFISEINSTTTTLGSNATFTGVVEDVSQFSSLTVFVYSDQASATNGLKLELSTDGVNWDRQKPITVKADSSQAHSLVIVSQFFRVSYQNGATAQTEFRLQTIYHKHKNKHLTTTNNETISDFNDVELIRVSNNTSLDLARGLYSGQKFIHKFGENLTVGTTDEDIWSNGGTYTWITSAETVRVKAGGNAADDSAGNNARKIMVEGLDSNFNEISEEITLAGASASSSTTATFIRVFRAYVTETGSYTAFNAGDIVIESTTSNDVLAIILANTGQTQMTQYTIPAGKTAFLQKIYVNASAKSDIFMSKRPNADTVSAPFSGRRLVQRFNGVTGPSKLDIDLTIKFTEKTDIWFTGKADTGTSAIDIAYDLVLVDNLS